MRRVPVERVLPDVIEEEHVEDSFIEPEEEVPEALSEEIPATDLKNDFDLATENEQLKKDLESLKAKMEKRMEENVTDEILKENMSAENTSNPETGKNREETLTDEILEENFATEDARPTPSETKKQIRTRERKPSEDKKLPTHRQNI